MHELKGGVIAPLFGDIMKKDKITITLVDYIKTILLAFVTAGAGLFAFIQLLDYIFTTSFFYTALPVSQKIVLFIGVTLTCGSIYCLFHLWQYYSNLMEAYKEQVQALGKQKVEEDEDSLVAILNTAYKAEHWKEVIKIGSQISSPLWYTGKFETRVRIGELVESAAGFSGEYYVQAETLLDDLGWTKFRLEMTKDAIKSIKRGLSIAKSHSFTYLIAKGNRHLADIHLAKACSLWTLRYLDMGNKSLPEKIDDAELKKYNDYYDLAIKAAEEIPDSIKKTEMLGNLLYTKAKYCLVIRNYPDAISSVDESLNYYKQNDDLERSVKLYNLKGKIQMMSGDETSAIETFQLGIQKSTEIANNIHTVTNSLSLAEYYLSESNLSSSERYLKTAEHNMQYINDPVLKRRCDELKVQLNMKKESHS